MYINGLTLSDFHLILSELFCGIVQDETLSAWCWQRGFTVFETEEFIAAGGA